MKLILILSAGLLLFTASAFSELTVEDLEKIRSIVKEEVDPVKEEIAKSEARMKEYVSQEIATVNVKIEEMDKRQTGAIEMLGKRLDHIFLLVLALVAFIAVVIGIPQIIVAMQQKDIRAQDEKFEAQQKQIEALLQDMETRKKERIVRP